MRGGWWRRREEGRRMRSFYTMLSILQLWLQRGSISTVILQSINDMQLIDAVQHNCCKEEDPWGSSKVALVDTNSYQQRTRIRFRNRADTLLLCLSMMC